MMEFTRCMLALLLMTVPVLCFPYQKNYKEEISNSNPLFPEQELSLTKTNHISTDYSDTKSRLQIEADILIALLTRVLNEKEKINKKENSIKEEVKYGKQEGTSELTLEQLLTAIKSHDPKFDLKNLADKRGYAPHLCNGGGC